jgi:hypothetical protein
MTKCKQGYECAGAVCVSACEAAAKNHASVGCDYYAVDMDARFSATGGCFAVFVANTSPSFAHVKASWRGVPLDLSRFAKIPQGTGRGIAYDPYVPSTGLAPSEVAILFLANDVNASDFGFSSVRCPVPAAIGAEAQVQGTGRGHAFHLEVDVPVVAYQMLPYGGGAAAVTGASLLVPTSAWGTNYIAVNAYPQDEQIKQPSLDLVASEDDTTITLLPKVAIAGQVDAGVAGGPANAPISFRLNAGETLQLTQLEELTGSPIQSDKPVGLWGGHQCVVVKTQFCDHAEQQIPAVTSLGHEYVAVAPRGRVSPFTNQETIEARPWRFVGAVDGTLLSYAPAPPPGAPTRLALGQVAEVVTSEPFVVKSQDKDHPFYMAGYMTGGNHFNGEGDADYVNVVAVDQWLDAYVFFTDPTYPETELVAIRAANQARDVDLDCLGKVGGWTPVGGYEVARVKLATGNFQGVGACNNGRHTMRSASPFALTVWGWGSAKTGGTRIDDPDYTQFVSYAYPAGAGARTVNNVVVPPVPK